LEEWRELLGLDQWSFAISFAEDLGGDDDGLVEHRAVSDLFLASKTAHIRWLESSPEEDDAEVMVHELVHVLLARIMTYVKGVIEAYVSDDRAKFFLYNLFETTLEETVNEMTSIFVDNDSNTA